MWGILGPLEAVHTEIKLCLAYYAICIYFGILVKEGLKSIHEAAERSL